MSIFYIDLDNGNDTNNGTTWANKECPTCNRTFYIRKREGLKRFSQRKYCSLKCRQVWNKNTIGICRPNKTSFSKGHKIGVGRELSEETKAKISANRKGKNTGARSEEIRRKISEAQKGEKSVNWKGGKSKELKRLRMSADFKIWRESVYKRDNWTCQECGQRGGKLHPHHIMPFAEYEDLRFDVNNGITLCVLVIRKQTATQGILKRK